MSIPYTGNKQKIAPMIYDTIVSDLLWTNSNTRHTLVDLFCGGFSISNYFLKNGWSVISNDKNKYVVALLEQVIFGTTDWKKKAYNWVSRELFHDILKNPNNYDDWYVGYVMCIWSFGNDQGSYMFGKDIEEYKRKAHELVVFGIDNKKWLADYCQDYVLKKHGHTLPFEFQDLVGSSVQDRRLHYRSQLTNWENKLKLESRLSIGHIENLERLQQLQQLQQLLQLEQLETLKKTNNNDRLILSSLSYDQVEIPDNCVIYCDLPYQNTVEYREGGFDHDKFWDWVRDKSKTHRVYVSEYNAPPDFEAIWTIPKRSTFAKNSQRFEKLFRIKKLYGTY